MLPLLKYWREFAIVAAIGVLLLAWQKHNADERALGALRERTRVADSTIAAHAKPLIIAETLLVHDTLKVKVAINHVTTFTDTVLRHLTDTVVVKEFVAKADSAAKVCTELANDCATFRREATATIDALRQKLAAEPGTIDRRRWYSDRFTLGPYAGVDVRGKPSAGVSAQFALVRFP
jgi:hypothetical protein